MLLFRGEGSWSFRCFLGRSLGGQDGGTPWGFCIALMLAMSSCFPNHIAKGCFPKACPGRHQPTGAEARPGAASGGTRRKPGW